MALSYHDYENDSALTMTVSQFRNQGQTVCPNCGQFHEGDGNHLYDYYQAVDEDLMCHICLQPLVNPVDTKCSHTFCTRCLENYLCIQNQCPVDRQLLTRNDYQQSSVLVRRCDCNHCAAMPTVDECLCCKEVGPVAEKMEDEDLDCITDHEGFTGNCLNRHVIEVSLYDFVERQGPIDDNEPIHELYRYVAYRRFTRWIWHILGKKRRKVIPACAVLKIREAFPSEDFTGFKYARP